MKKRYIVCLLILGLAMQYVGVGQMIGLIGFALFFCSFWFLIIAIGIERRKSETLGAKYEKAVSEKKKMSETPVSKDTKPTVTSETLGAKYEKAISEKKKMSEMPVNKGAKPAVTTESSAKTRKESNYIFNVAPEKYANCRDYLRNLEYFLYLDGKYNVFSHYVAINKTDGKLYEIHTRVVGFAGGSVHTQAIEDFAMPPRELTIEEFVDLADSKYPSISVMYEGINENNLQEYEDVLDQWEGIPEEKKPLTGIDRSKISYEFKQSYEECKKWSANHDERYPLLAISEFLFSKGFKFADACVGGGVDEISHTGAVAYRAKYTKFEAFRDNFHEDISRADDEAEKRYGEWFSYLDYSYISVHLAMDQLSIGVVIMGDTRVRINWSNLKEEHAQLLDDVNKRMRDILIGNVVFTTERYYK